MPGQVQARGRVSVIAQQVLVFGWLQPRLGTQGAPDHDFPLSLSHVATPASLIHIVPLGGVYMSPGSVTEILHFFVAEYSKDMRVGDGGGVAHEHENIEVLELPFGRALAMIDTGEIKDAKTIMLLQWAALDGPFREPTRPTGA